MNVFQAADKLIQLGFDTRIEDNVLMVYSTDLTETSRQVDVLLKQWGYSCSWGVRFKKQNQENESATSNFVSSDKSQEG